MSKAQNLKSAEVTNTPSNVMANAARFNKQFLDSQLGGNPATVSIGKMLTVMSEQDNTIRVLSKILARDYNEQHLHDMHNSLFGDIASGPTKLSINLFIYESGPIEEKIEDVLFM
jgi:hypothetical protein